MTDATGSLATPDHPKLYPANIHCLWLIHIPKAKRIYVEFEEFDLEQSEDCVKDFVAYTEDGQLSANSVLRFACTHEPWEYEFPSGRIFLEFSSDSNGTAQGFRANYATNVRSQIEGEGF